ncbi:MAG: hypothetical protein IRZ16_07780 [Myxococcaceae bacterium]|nr:hypothetical protein [Myxococcaceae bacterium]
MSLFFSVDTCSGDPVPGLTADRFKVYEDDVAVSAFESQQRIVPRGRNMRLYSLLLLDLSGSVLRSGDYPKLRKAADVFLDRVFAEDPEMQRVAIFAFDGQKQLTPVVGFTGDRAALTAGLDSLEVHECDTNAQCVGFADRRTCAGWRCVDDSTNLYGAVTEGVATLDAALQAEPDIALKQGALVLFTDGTDQAARVSREDAEAAVAHTASSVFSVGLGGEIDRTVLSVLGRDGFFSATSADGLSEAFSQVAARLTAQARRYYVLEYCSPRRGGHHTLRVEAAWPLDPAGELRGSLSTDFDATGFESGCDLSAL